LANLISQAKAANQPFGEELVLDYAENILSGLEYLHSNGVIHTNINPE
jgi:serine/threonine protein kinase